MKRYAALGVFLGLLLAILGGCSGSNGATSKASGAPSGVATSNSVQVTLQDKNLKSSRTTFIAGRAYTFVVTNKGTAPHNFIIDTRRDAPTSQGANNRILFMIDQSKLPPGATRSVTYTFPLSTPQSTVQLATQLGSIDNPGIVIPITVKK
ncbi:hypothetical protein [Dictyobacter aurantiacus]|uniref:EfeO-type cupredoxin-like domain-containing protein n=1 Tax=Dictyobacter aurantiacus TaxID=1936993 RepID=A0A401ZJ91_9CHLR|nr:hypothetical protein [Dictyobacter aurantiacus]GCE06927.1 hypothetical protein KDAU_42560 [Dictyobacter aurantiacus]